MPIKTLDDIFNYAEVLQQTVRFYENGGLTAELESEGSTVTEDPHDEMEVPPVTTHAELNAVPAETPEPVQSTQIPESI